MTAQALACLERHPLSLKTADQVTPADLKAFRDHLLTRPRSRNDPRAGKPLSPASKNRYVSALSAAFRQIDSPLPAIPPLKTRRTIGNILTGSELEELLRIEMPERVNLLMRILARTGLRIGEALALQHASIRDGTIYVVQSLTVKGRLIIKDTKSERSTRAVPMSPDLAAAIGKGRGFVIHRHDRVDIPLWPRNARRDWQKALAETKFAHVEPHDLRRTLATLMMENGIPLHDAMAIMGHDSKMLLEVYSRSNSSGKRDAIAKLFGSVESKSETG